MFNVGGGEFLVIMLVALVVLGPTKLPEAARQAGKIMGEFRRISAGFQREMREAMNDPVGKAISSNPGPWNSVTKASDADAQVAASASSPPAETSSDEEMAASTGEEE